MRSPVQPAETRGEWARMLHVGFLVATLILFLTLPAAAGPAEDFAAANRSYADGDYASARRSYERALADGPRVNVLYNLGNASFRQGETGRAILNYERALALQPRHPDATANLKLAREKSGARVPGERWWHRGFLWFSPSTATALAVGGCWFFLLLGGSIVGRRKGAARTFACGVGVLLVAGYAAGVRWAMQEQGRVAIVVAARAEGRSEPAERSSVMETLPSGSRVQMISEQAGWTYCRLPGGQRGWLPSGSVESLVPDGK